MDALPPIMMTTMAAMLGACRRARHWRRRRDAPAARNLHCRRTHREPDADSLHDTVHVSVSRPLWYVVQSAVVAALSVLGPECARGAGATPMNYSKDSVLPFAIGRAAACAVGPNYHRPSAPRTAALQGAEGWKPAEPQEAASGSTGGPFTAIPCSTGSKSRSTFPIRR